jgi:hypothetical protein
MKYKGLAAVPLLAAAIGLAACSSSPSTTSGTLTLHGSTTNLAGNGSLPLTITGPNGIATTGTLPGGNGTKGVIKTGAGNLDVTHTNPPNTNPKVNASACTFTGSFGGTYKVTGGTGKFSGATGHGSYAISLNGTFAKTGGKCVINQNTNPNSGVETFHASGPLTISG